MKILQDVPASAPGFSSSMSGAAEQPPRAEYEVRSQPKAGTAVRWDDWESRSVRWSRLMRATQAGDNKAYEQLLREVDAWLSRYYARRLPHPAAEDARQDVLLAIHAKRHTYNPSKPFGAWVTAIARYKWVDRIRDASRYSALSPDEEIPIGDHEGAAISAATLDLLLGKLKPAQESVIRLVKLKGLSVARASGVTGQSTALVKVNIHRGLKKLADLVS
jgi:RNA polymerase sigma-70 factor (ECF subfamily)